MNNKGKYDDIINLPHHVSKKHPQMSIDAIENGNIRKIDEFKQQ